MDNQDSVFPVPFNTPSLQTNSIAMVNNNEENLDEANDSQLEKGIQAGKGTAYTERKKKPKIKRKSKSRANDEDVINVDPDENCIRHSFCVVEALRQQGVQPVKPKGLPWASGKLLYLPGQRPKGYKKLPEDKTAEIKRKKKKKKQRELQKKKIENELRKGDNVQLCYVLNTTQELMLLMRVISMVMAKKKLEQQKRVTDTQWEDIPDEDNNEENTSDLDANSGENEEDDMDDMGGMGKIIRESEELDAVQSNLSFEE